MDDAKRLTCLFRHYFDQTCTPAEKDELFDLLQRAEHDELLKRLIDETWSQTVPLHSQADQTAARILEQILRRQQTRPLSPDRPFVASGRPGPILGRLRTFRYAGYAAALAMMTVAAFLLYYLQRSPTLSRPRFAAVTSAPSVNDSCLSLPDGSKVLLHKDAHIGYTSGLTGAVREVTLHGEAYFDIRRDSRPFVVHTGSITTTVLGTAFNINAPDDRTITITVTKGKVKVENEAGEYSILRKNEQLSVDSLHKQLKKIPVDAGEVIRWKKPYLLFNDVTMKDAMQELAQRYHVAIVFTNPAAESCPVTASFTGGETLEEVIKVLSKINNMEYRMRPGTVEISGDGCK